MHLEDLGGGLNSVPSSHKKSLSSAVPALPTQLFLYLLTFQRLLMEP